MRRLLVVSLVMAGCAVVLATSCLAAVPEQALAEKYSPVLRVQTQEEPCEAGEPYTPLDVQVLFDNVEVAFRGPWDRVNLVKTAPTAADLGQGYPQHHLDFPGNALDPGCDYETWSKRIAEGTVPTAYARVVAESSYPRKLALQYWLFYAYNDFNNKHEGDWEMIQLAFDAPDAQAALAVEPTEVGYSQHEGAERGQWGADKLELVDGTHPVVYPAVGSHANFFEPALYLGRSAAQGVGCDDTTGPHTDLRVRVALVPTAEDDYLVAYPWLGYQGRWGEKQEAFYNGPTGPNLKRQWTEPIAWSQQKWRDKSFAVPGGALADDNATGAFCGVIAAGSDLLTKAVLNPLPVFLGLAAILALVIVAATRTRWTPATPVPAEQRRAWGQMMSAAAALYRRRFRTFVGLGLLYVPTAVVATTVQVVLFKLTRFEALADSAGEQNGFVVVLALATGLVFYLLSYVLVLAAVTRALTTIAAGEEPGVVDTYRSILGDLGPLARVAGWLALTVVASAVFIVTIPIGIYLLVRWAFAVQAVAVEGRGGRNALARSAELVRGRWWGTGAFAAAITGLGAATGPLVGVLLLLGTSRSFLLVNAVAALVYAVTIPFVGLALTYLYYDRRATEHDVKAPDATAVTPASAAQ